MIELTVIQSYMRERNIDGWLIYDYHQTNPAMIRWLPKNEASRRVFVLIPTEGQPVGVAHIIDREHLEKQSAVSFSYYTNWKMMHQNLERLLKGKKTLAMEYSLQGAVPTVSHVDAGTMELVKQFVPVIVSSQDLFQMETSLWTKQALQSHIEAVTHIRQIKDDAFQLISHRLQQGKELNEYEVQQYILSEMKKRNLETEHLPIVAVNKNSGNPHYEPSKTHSSFIRKGDLIMIDLWARKKGQENIYADITWMGYAGIKVPEKYKEVFRIVAKARDIVVQSLNQAWEEKREMEGWELDRIARNFIEESGYGDFFIHRTGHSIGPGKHLHALGVNLDDFETHDTRKIMSGSGFSVEPGIYLDEFGIRTEINVYYHKENGISIYTPLQDSILPLL